MRVLVTGSRDFPDGALVDATICGFISGQGHPETAQWDRSEVVIVHGGCPSGADAQAAAVAKRIAREPFSIPLREEVHPAQWDARGRSAGFIRNQEMVDLGADVCLAFLAINAANRGTKHCAGRAKAAGIPVWYVTA